MRDQLRGDVLIEEQCDDLLVQFERPHIEVARADPCHLPVDRHRLGVQKRFGVSMNSDAGQQQRFIVGTLRVADEELIDVIVDDQMHLGTAMNRGLQRILQRLARV